MDNLNPGRAKKVKETISEAVKILDQIEQQVSSNKSVSDYSYTIWEIFSKMEYSIMLLKLHLGTENPGRLIKQVKIHKNDREMLVEVSNEMINALNNLQAEKYLKALESARIARNILHATLLVIRKVQAKQV